jgi:hypothetical protein
MRWREEYRNKRNCLLIRRKPEKNMEERIKNIAESRKNKTEGEMKRRQEERRK